MDNRKKEDFAELTIDLHIGIGRNKTTRKKGNPKSTLKAESWKLPLFHSFLNVVANESKGMGALQAKEPVSHAGAQSASR